MLRDMSLDHKESPPDHMPLQAAKSGDIKKEEQFKLLQVLGIKINTSSKESKIGLSVF